MLGAGLDRPAFVVALLAARKREEMDLVVAGDAPAVRTVHEAGASHTIGIAAGQAARCRRRARSRAPARAARERPAGAPRLPAPGPASLSVARAPKMPKYSGSTTSRAPSEAALPDQRFRLREIRFDVAARNRLHRGDAHFHAGVRHRSLVDLGQGRRGRRGTRVAAAALRDDGIRPASRDRVVVAKDLLDGVLQQRLREERARADGGADQRIGEKQQRGTGRKRSTTAPAARARQGAGFRGARSVSPEMSTFAAGPTSLRSDVDMTPFAIFTLPEMSSNAKPSLKTSL